MRSEAWVLGWRTLNIQPNRLRLDYTGPGEPQRLLSVKQGLGGSGGSTVLVAFDPEAPEEDQVGEDEA